MATKKVRVYELARELGVENGVVIDLAQELRIGVKSHSSSIDEPSADRVRRLADERGLRKEKPPEKPAPVKSGTRKVVSARSSQVSKPAPTGEVEEHRVVRSAPTEPESEEVPAEAAPSASPRQRAPRQPNLPPPMRDVGAPPRSPTGKVIPPPPGSRRTPQSRAPAPGARPRRQGPVFPRSGEVSFPKDFASRTEKGRPARDAGRGQQPPRSQYRKKRKKRRRLEEEDFGPMSAGATPQDAPVPEEEIVVPRGITIQEYAPKLNRTPSDLVKMLFEAGEMVTATQSLADEMIELIAESLGAQILLVEPGEEREAELQALFEDDEAADEALAEPRPPVVTVMGHVDHGKTTLLDAIRKSNVVAGEAGGITQAIGAYQIMHDGHPITFIDTPGHEAFTAMRARGALATDIAVLVVAADDGVKPQTIEAIAHARSAEVPIIVAVTKVDKEDADPTRARQQLSEHELVPEEWGGQTIFIDVAAPAGQGLDQLLESILLTAEVEELKANPKGPARAFVLESNLDPGRGAVVSALIERGTLHPGDPIVAGGAWGRVRALFDENGNQLEEALPAKPVEILGLSDVPMAGDELRVAPSDKVARTVAEGRARTRHAAAMRHRETLTGGAKLEDIFEAVQRGEVATLNLVLKADSQGSLEALTDSLRKLDQDHEEVRLSFVHRAVGGITESDVDLAAVSTASIIGFNVRPDRKARDLADQRSVELRLYEVIYKIVEEVNAALLGMLKPEFEEVVTGEAEVREVFGVPKLGKVAGCYVVSGVITRGSKVRFLREGTIIWKGAIVSLRRFKDDVREVKEGFECGVGLENYSDLKPGDIIETFEEREIPRT